MLAGPEYVFFRHYNKNHKGIWFHTNRVYNKDFECKKNAPQATFFDENIAPQAKIMGQIAPQARFFLSES